MKKQNGLGLIGVLFIICVLALTAAGVVVLPAVRQVWQRKIAPTPTPTTTDSQIQKIADECGADSDCEYVWFTGGCHTPEYVKAVLDRAEKEGMRLGEAPPREHVVCECQNNKCVEKNHD